FTGENEASERSVCLLNFDRSDGANRGDIEADAPNAIFLAFRNSRERELAFGAGGNCEVVEFLFEFSMAEQETERRAQVVQLFGRDTLYLRGAVRPEPGILAIE